VTGAETDSSWAGPLGGLLAGAAMGLVISALGAGGSIFIVPVFLYLFHEPVAVATGTSLAVVGAGALVGAVMHYRRGNVRLRVALAFSAGSMVAAPVGAAAHALVPDRVAVGLFSLVLVAAAARMVMGTPTPRPAGGEHRLTLLVPLGVGVGLLCGFLGVGGGFLILPALVVLAHLPLKQAVGTSLAVIALTSITGSIGYAAKGLVSADLLISVGGGAMLGALAGAPLGAMLPERPVRLVFAAVAATVALYMLARAVL
jgi:uncharacterized membrane protein YfcA